MSCFTGALLGALALAAPADAASLLGPSLEFPDRYHTSVRGLSNVIKRMRPQNLEAMGMSFKIPDAPIGSFMLLVNATELGVDVPGLGKDVERLERHFREIPVMHTPGANLHVDAGHGHPERHSFKLTNLSDLYNIFFLNSEAIGRLYWAVKLAFHKYAEVHSLDLSRLYFLHGWFNCFRGGSKIQAHAHGYAVSGGPLRRHHSTE
eukprot:TRINITY_DN47181_c0_g1_i4.p1 TRINITY_DN47181_c0_g1~~TRINITY_DN47181_c0_g1_i4.p1  ORF type:complete len:206 (+),score=31.65 TRINITY_DN47181_c0_g1_i4:83-700(+)